MSLLYTAKYEVRHPMLKHLIKYFWTIKSSAQTVINHKLLPVNNMDIIVNFSAPIKYTSADNVEIVTAKSHFNGIRDEYLTINQVGTLDVIGISFFPAGLYPFLKVPLSEFKNKTIELDNLMNKFTSQIEEKVSITDSIIDKIDVIEKELVKCIDTELIPAGNVYHMFSRFYKEAAHYNISQFCDEYGINQRKLERCFNKYIGITPMFFQRLTRYQNTLNTMIHNKTMDLTTLAHENNYYDQNHFIKEFKAFTGCNPTKFFNEKKSIKQIMHS